jgi:VWFA-related protein
MLAAPLLGQSDAPVAGSDEAPLATLRVQSNEVNLVFSVTDKKGHFITGLKQDDLHLTDNGLPPERVLRFVQQTDLPLRVGLMLDTSSSIMSRFQFEQGAAVNFLQQTLRAKTDQAFVEGFDTSLERVQDYTNRIDLLSAGIGRLKPGGGTALFDALYVTCRDRMLTLSQSEPMRRVVILVSDGEDDYSRMLEKDAIQECLRADTLIYAISTNTSTSKTKGDDVLNALAQATGGVAFFPRKLEEMAGYFRSIQQELRSQYQLVYRPADFLDNGSFHAIVLQAHDRNDLVRVKRGYFAPRPMQSSLQGPEPAR